MKHVHLLFVVLAISSFIARFLLAYFKSDLLQRKLFKIAPHVIDTLLLVTGITLLFKGNWLDGDFMWVISKIILLVAYVGLGVVSMRAEGQKRWFAFLGALACFAYMFIIAVTKHGFL